MPPASLEGCVDLGVGMCNSSGAKTLRAFAAEAWEGLAEASGGGRALARTRPGVPGGRDRVVSGSLSSQLWGVNQASRRRWT